MRSLILVLFLLAIPAWCDGLAGHWSLVEVETDGQKNRDPRWEFELWLESDGQAKLWSRQTTEIRTTSGVKSRMDEVELEGKYRVEGKQLVFFWKNKSEAQALLEANFGPLRADGSRQVNFDLAKQLALSGPRILRFARATP
ncbi:MAG: hypothetical protein AB7S38_12355 [Vulcanimicrobiota bacterium]